MIPINDTEVELVDGRIVRAARNGDLSHCLIVAQKGEMSILSRRCFEQEYDRLWQYAFFVPVKRGQYSFDLNGDGDVEIGVATWDGGNNISERFALIFSILGDRLVYFGRKKFNLEYGEALFE